QPLHQKPLRADRIKRLQQHRPQQLLRRDRRPPNRRIEPSKLTLQRRKRLVHDPPDRSKRMIPPHPRLQVNVAEQLARSIVVASHVPSPNLVGLNESPSIARCEPPFSTACLGSSAPSNRLMPTTGIAR